MTIGVRGGKALTTPASSLAEFCDPTEVGIGIRDSSRDPVAGTDSRAAAATRLDLAFFSSGD